MNPDLKTKLDAALASGDLLEASHGNISEMLAQSSESRYELAVTELAEGENWGELNDRFFKKMAFGTGGLRGRTIGRVVPAVEKGTPNELGRPEFPCTGTNALNFYNLTRATLGLVRAVKKAHVEEAREGRPSVVLAHDTRHFHQEFAELVAKVVTENGCDMYLFSGPRSTPHLSFAVRHLNASSGIVLTASHNPPHDNGFKVYWNDGAQVVDPYASAIVNEVNSISGDSYDAVPESEQGKTTILDESIDEAYMTRLETLILDPAMVREATALNIVFTNLHGTGGKISPQMLRRLGFNCDTVPEQDTEDGRFPTVDSPNPENAPALKMAIDQAERDKADIVIGTDPDADRMGVAVRDGSGEMKLLTGNQIGSLMAWYRLKTFADQNILTNGNNDRFTLVKTFVTTELQRAIAEKYGVRCVNTLTGFKYIGAKLRKYEEQIPAELREGYATMTDKETRDLRLEHSTFFAFGGEESYGYLGADFLRDKDANGAVVMFAELAAYALSQGTNLIDLMDQLYLEFGYYLESQKAVVMEGADGAAKIATLAKSYSDNAPTEIDGAKVTDVKDFATMDIRDEEGDLIPKEGMLFVEMADGRAMAVRPSGTEPKIKFYLYFRPAPGETGGLPVAFLPEEKMNAAAQLKSLGEWIDKDIEARLS